MLINKMLIDQAMSKKRAQEKLNFEILATLVGSMGGILTTGHAIYAQRLQGWL